MHRARRPEPEIWDGFRYGLFDRFRRSGSKKETASADLVRISKPDGLDRLLAVCMCCEGRGVGGLDLSLRRKSTRTRDEEQLEKLSKFVEDYNSELRVIEDALDQSFSEVCAC